MFSLSDKVGLVVGVANEQSIAWGCAKAFHSAGAEIAVTYLNDRAEPHVRALAETLDAQTPTASALPSPAAVPTPLPPARR